MPRLYALLVGINEYPKPIPNLQGCVNDVDAMVAYLEDRTTQSGIELHLLTLKNKQAKRSAIIQGFREHLGKATQDDFVLFAFSGHGSQANAPEAHWTIEPDRMNETLVCWDSRLREDWDLADKELAGLIAEVACSEPQITIILDCCHAGSGSRVSDDNYTE